jgi:dephospho-CoA kinase
VSRPIAVAITGGIGAGKSEALAAFGRRGAATVSSDEIVHDLLLREEVREAVAGRFGTGVLAIDGQLDRGAIAAIVFADAEALSWLEALLHPLVSAEYLEWREQLGQLARPPLVCVTEVPLLYEAGSERYFDKVVVLTAPEAVREARAVDAIAERDRRFLPEEEKAGRADYVYANTGSLAELEAFVASVLVDLGV